MRIDGLALTGILAILLLAPSVARPQKAPSAYACDNGELSTDHPLSALPKTTQVILRRAVRSKLLAIVNDIGIGVSGTKVDRVPLNAIAIANTSKTGVLYFVAWDDRSFGVNGFNWLIEVKGSAATSLLSDHAQSVSGGFGVKVFGTGKEPYRRS